MLTRTLGSRAAKGIGCAAMILGTIDPLEGSVLILAGSGLLAWGCHLGGGGRRAVRYWLLTFGLIAAGVAALFGLSAVGGFGGSTGRSLWWGLLILPYPIGWVLALAAGVAALTRRARSDRPGVAG